MLREWHQHLQPAVCSQHRCCDTKIHDLVGQDFKGHVRGTLTILILYPVCFNIPSSSISYNCFIQKNSSDRKELKYVISRQVLYGDFKKMLLSQEQADGFCQLLIRCLKSPRGHSNGCSRVVSRQRDPWQLRKHDFPCR